MSRRDVLLRAYPALRSSLLRAGIDLRRATTSRRQLFDSIITVRDAQRASEAETANSLMDYVLRNAARSHSQRFQDLVALFVLGEPRSGFFVEFGAADGILNSNTVLLERDYGWTGILCEPARIWHDALSVNRECSIDWRCVASQSGKMVRFCEHAEDPQLSTVAGTENRRYDTSGSSDASAYLVETISLIDLLRYHGAPVSIDYMSIDTEGTEWSILQEFDFGFYLPRLITVEHNGEPNRSLIRSLLEGFGYRRILEDLSGWDDWYVHSSVDSADI